MLRVLSLLVALLLAATTPASADGGPLRLYLDGDPVGLDIVADVVGVARFAPGAPAGAHVLELRAVDTADASDPLLVDIDAEIAIYPVGVGARLFVIVARATATGLAFEVRTAP